MKSTYVCRHAADGEEHERPRTLLNPHNCITRLREEVNPAVLRFHQSLPEYGSTPLHTLPTIAKELGVAHVFVKEESNRFGLPSFKIAGASWAIYKVLCRRKGLDLTVSIDRLKQALAQDANVRLTTCTEGNWGRAVARMARYLDITATIYVPGFMDVYTQDLIRSEGATVVVLDGQDYDDSIRAAVDDSKATGAVLVMDTAIDGFYDIPGWVTDGYSTILAEADAQVCHHTNGLLPNLITCSVGVGSWAEAIVKHYKSISPEIKVVTVEPDTAASFKESLHIGEITPIKTGETIMNGMNCGTTSSLAWRTLRTNVDIATTVSDVECHACVKELHSLAVNAGPCGAANLAGVRHVLDGMEAAERQDLIVMMFSSEGMREYKVPV